MTRIRRLVMLVVACLVALSVQAVSPASAAYPPLLTGVRASHQPGFDRVVFDFYGGLPSSTSARYVDGPALSGDPSGLPGYVAGRRILQVTFQNARGHKVDGTDTSPNRTAFALPEVLTAVQSGDNEGVVIYGIGVASTQSYRVFTLSSPPRVVIDIDTAFTW